MASSSSPRNLYARAGITDLAEFYATRFASDEVLDARYFSSINRFDIRWARTIWVYDNVRPRSSVLDLGCGSGILALLKRKAVLLAGVDLSASCAQAARRNGYDSAQVAKLDALPFADGSFDYVVSLDVMGHIEFEHKDAVLREIRRVLRPEGVTMHGIECMDRVDQKDYQEMNEEELRHFIGIDGHVGMEDEATIANRFACFFKHVETRPRFAASLSLEELLKLADEYGTPRCDPDLLDYLRGMSFKERRAFNIAMGWVFHKLSEVDLRFPRSGYVLLKASAGSLGSFYNEYRTNDDSNLAVAADIPQGKFCLDRSTRATFDSGWYEAESFPPIARWMSECARVRFWSASVSEIRLNLTTNMPDLETRPLRLDFLLSGICVLSVSLIKFGWIELRMHAPPLAGKQNSSDLKNFELEIRADRTWRPGSVGPNRIDDRELSVAVCNIEVFP